MRCSLAVVLLALLGGCATAPGPTGRSSTLSDLLLALDASEKMGGDPGCRSRSLSATEVLVPVELTAQGVFGRWTARWTVDRCVMAVPYVVKFDRALDGDLDVSMQREVSEAETTTVPGDTLADRILRRDTLAFLAHRDLSEAGPEARCRTRKGDRPIAGRWVERWTLDRCVSSVADLVRFNTTPKGTTFIAELQR